jgi:hypothetical protein
MSVKRKVMVPVGAWDIDGTEKWIYGMVLPHTLSTALTPAI